jgi:hypothetical protein
MHFLIRWRARQKRRHGIGSRRCGCGLIAGILCEGQRSHQREGDGEKGKTHGNCELALEFVSGSHTVLPPKVRWMTRSFRK